MISVSLKQAGKFTFHYCQNPVQFSELYAKNISHTEPLPTLESHISTVHKMEKNFNCDTCENSFTTSAGLRHHIENIHNKERNENTERFQCDICEKEFASTSYARQHFFNEHENKEPFKCDICNQTFVTKTVLKFHTAAIHSQKLFECELCSKTFVNKFQVDNHLRKVHKDNSVVKKPCAICGKAFTYLNRHLKVHSLTTSYKCTLLHGKIFDDFRGQN